MRLRVKLIRCSHGSPKGDDKMHLRNKTLKEKVAYYAETQRESRDMPDCYIGFARDTILRAFLKNYEETRNFILTADTDELECFISVLSDFIKKYPNEEIIQLCINRKAQVGDFYTLDFTEEIECAKKLLSDNHKKI